MYIVLLSHHHKTEKIAKNELVLLGFSKNPNNSNQNRFKYLTVQVGLAIHKKINRRTKYQRSLTFSKLEWVLHRANALKLGREFRESAI